MGSKVKPGITLQPDQIIIRYSPAIGCNDIIRDPDIRSVYPHIAVFGFEVHFRRTSLVDRILQFPLHIIVAYRNTDIRICLLPGMWIFPVVILRTFLPILFIRAENHNKLVFLLFDSLKDIDHHFPGLIIRRFHIKPGCRNSKNKRLFPGTHTGFNHIKNVIRRPCMTFVADSTMRIQTVLVPAILGKRFKSRCRRFHNN